MKVQRIGTRRTCDLLYLALCLSFQPFSAFFVHSRLVLTASGNTFLTCLQVSPPFVLTFYQMHNRGIQYCNTR